MDQPIAATGEAIVTFPVLDIDVFGEEFLADPYAFHPSMREAGPIFSLPQYNLLAMARHAEVSVALKDWETYISSRGVGLSDFATEKPWRPPSLLLETDPPVHDRTRSLMAKIVSINALKELRPIWLDEARKLVGELVERRDIDVVRDLAQEFPLRIFPQMIGLRDGGREHLLLYAMATFNAFGPRNAIFRATDEAAGSAVKWVTEACERKNLREGGWGASVYAAADAGQCTEEEAARLVRSFLSAGVDTTINGIANMMYAFALHPAQWAKLKEKPSLIKRVFDESLRWDSTVQTFFRTTSRVVHTEAGEIPAGSKVLLFLGSANRDPDKWERAEEFDIERIASGHVGFGFGIHQCLGQMVARQEAEVVLTALLEQVEGFSFAGEVKRSLNNTLHSLGSLPVTLEPVSA